MKKIIFVIPSIKIGGIENALLNMLQLFDYDKYKVYLYIFHCDKKRIDKVNKNVEIIYGGRFLDIAAMTSLEAKSRGIVVYIFRMALAALCRLFGARLVYSLIMLFEKEYKGFDYAISYSNNVNINSTYYGANLFTLRKISANKKLAWLHVDYEAMNMNSKVNNSEYKAFDRIIAVSEAVRDSFLKYNPNLQEKTVVVYNVLSERENGINNIQKSISDSIKTIVTVGRLDGNKNQIECIKIAEKLYDNGFQFKWILIGDGTERKLLEDQIKEKGLENIVFITGYVDDVVSELERADLFVSTSLSESYGMAIVEAQARNIPVIVKEYPAAKEIIDGTNGRLVENYEEMYQVVKELMESSEKYVSLKRNTRLLHDDSESMKRLEYILDNCK